MDIRGRDLRVAGIFVFAWCVGSASMMGQSLSLMAALPDAPSAVLGGGQSGVATVGSGGSLAGVVVDESGAAVAGASVMLVDAAGKSVGLKRTTAHGEYSFDGLAAGAYDVTIKATGFGVMSTPAIAVGRQQAVVVPSQVLHVAASMDVEVNADRTAEAEMEIKAAEKQRVLGVVPNFYESFQWDAAPLNTKQKYKLMLRDTFDPVGFATCAIGAEAEQLEKAFPGYGYGWPGYAKRYAALYGDGLFADVLANALFPQVFGTDPRYFYQGTGTKMSRLKHAVAIAFVTRSDKTGKNVPNYSYVAAALVSGAISNAYYPHANRGASLVFENAGFSVGFQAIGGVLNEFLWGPLTAHKAGKGKAQP